jgi:hypothetical protein
MVKEFVWNSFPQISDFIAGNSELIKLKSVIDQINKSGNNDLESVVAEFLEKLLAEMSVSTKPTESLNYELYWFRLILYDCPEDEMDLVSGDLDSIFFRFYKCTDYSEILAELRNLKLD